MVLDVISTTLYDAKIAEQHGADRISVFTSISEGGLTPSYGLIKKIKESVNVPVYVMIRPHNQSFHYNEDDLHTMISDIKQVKSLNADGIIIGCLTEEKLIDEVALTTLLNEANGLDITFNLAFDEVYSQEQALETLLKYPQVKRVMTSGADKSALNGIPQIKKIMRKMRDEPLVFVGVKGLKPENLKAFLSVTDVQEVCLGAGVRVNCQYTQPMDCKSVQAAKTIIEKIPLIEKKRCNEINTTFFFRLMEFLSKYMFKI
ncbi:copper homeostasis protein CutC [Priestia megaterium]|nr:copper homeostasis protein CutC [Priestia megaterium]